MSNPTREEVERLASDCCCTEETDCDNCMMLEEEGYKLIESMLGDKGVALLKRERDALLDENEQLKELRTQRASDHTGHLMRCAKVNGEWSCHKGCPREEIERLKKALQEEKDATCDECAFDQYENKRQAAAIEAAHQWAKAKGEKTQRLKKRELFKALKALVKLEEK